MEAKVTCIPVKKRLRFREDDDLALLREVAGQNPFENPQAWNDIKENMSLLTGKLFIVKTLKDHVDLIIKLWVEKNKCLKDKSGIEEVYSEKEQLCQNIFDYMVQFKGKQLKTKKIKLGKENGKIDRDNWANMFHCNVSLENEPCGSVEIENKINTEMFPGSEEKVPLYKVDIFVDTTPSREIEELIPEKRQSSKVLRPIRTRKRKANVQRQGLLYLEEYDKKQMEIKKQEQQLEEKRLSLEEKKLAIEERKLQLAERKFYLEEFERKKNLEILEKKMVLEFDQIKQLNRMIETKDQIINILVCKQQQ